MRRECVWHTLGITLSPPHLFCTQAACVVVSSGDSTEHQEGLAVRTVGKCPAFTGRKGRLRCSKSPSATCPVLVPLCICVCVCVHVHVCVKARGQPQLGQLA